MVLSGRFVGPDFCFRDNLGARSESFPGSLELSEHDPGLHRWLGDLAWDSPI
jgi:hypothetical protein